MKVFISWEVGDDPLFLFSNSSVMVHPLVPQVLDLASPVAESLGLQVVGAIFHTNQHPPILRVDIRNLERDTSLDDCEQMSRALENALDITDIFPDAYVLEISSPGISRILSTDREFVSFKGFAVTVMTTEPYSGHQLWVGQLIQRDKEAVHISQKGRAIAIPLSLVAKVQLEERHQ